MEDSWELVYQLPLSKTINRETKKARTLHLAAGSKTRNKLPGMTIKGYHCNQNTLSAIILVDTFSSTLQLRSKIFLRRMKKAKKEVRPTFKKTC